MLHGYGKAAFVADLRGKTLAGKVLLEGVEDFAAHPDNIGYVLCAVRDDHAFLKVGATEGVLAAIDDIHHGHGEAHGRVTGDVIEVAVEGQAAFGGGSAGGSE